MHSAPSQPDPQDPRWDEIRDQLPVVEQWVATVADLLRTGRKSEEADHAPVADEAQLLVETVRDCALDSPDRLDDVEPQLRNVDQIPIEELPTNADERLRLRAVFEQYKVCREELTRGQWAVVCLSFRDGLSQADIAQRLSKSRSTVHGRLKRARIRKEKYQRRVRTEKYELARKYLNK